MIECKIVPSYVHGLSENLLPVLVNNFKLGYISFRVAVCCTMMEYCASRWGFVFFEPAFKVSAWFPNVRRITVLISAGLQINHILAQLYWNFVIWMHKWSFKCIASFEDYLDFKRVLKYSSKFFTQSLHVRDCDKEFLGGFLVGGLVHMRPFVRFFQEPVRVAVTVQNLVQVVHLLS